MLREMKRVFSPEKHEQYEKLLFANHDLEGYRGNANTKPPLDEAANDYFLYALMSSNAYYLAPFFDLRKFGWIWIHKYHDNFGFNADVYKNEKENRIVIAFRGTNFFEFKDWRRANCKLNDDKSQYSTARDLVKKMRKKYSGYKFTATGHSLGGGLALHVSLRKVNVDAITFNSSPRVFAGDHIKENKRVIISEHGEVLQFIRKIFTSLKKVGKIDYYKYDFIGGTIFREHKMYDLARGMLKVAAVSGNKTALEIMKDILE